MDNDLHSDRLRVPAGTILFRAGDPCRGFVDVLSGRIRVSLTAPNGRNIILYRVDPQQVCLQTFNCLMEGHAYGAEGVAETDLEALLISQGDFHRRLADDTNFRNRLLQSISMRFGDFLQLIQSVALTSMEARLAKALVRLAGTGTVVVATQDELARETGSAREVVSRHLAGWRRAGLVHSGRGKVQLLDRRALVLLAAGAE